MLSYPVEMSLYIKPGMKDGEKPTLVKEAPEEFKELARKLNQGCLKITGDIHYIIEGDEEEENNGRGSGSNF